MRTWILLAVVGHLLNGVGFVIDKSLLSSAFKRSATYAVLIGLFSFAGLLLFPWVKAWPAGSAFWFTVAFGAVQVLALWAFFESLSRAEATRVVPLVGALVPVFTLIGTSLFAREWLSERELFGFGLLLVATLVLTSVGEKKGRLTASTIALAVLAAALFSTSFVTGKLAYARADFLGVFTLSRLFVGIAGVCVGLIEGKARKEIVSLMHGGATKGNAGMTALAQVLGSAGFILLNIAIAQGSAAIVNALQAIQYGAIVLIAWFGGKRIQQLLNEKPSARVMIIKTAAILAIGLGLALIA